MNQKTIGCDKKNDLGIYKIENDDILHFTKFSVFFTINIPMSELN